MMMANDGTTTECTCGYKYRLQDPKDADESAGAGTSSSSTLPARMASMDLSFVHLDGGTPTLPAAKHPPQLPEQPVPPYETRGVGASLTEGGDEHGHSGFWGRYRYLKAVERVIDHDDGPATEDGVRLCPVCIARVERALIADAERIEQEVSALYDAVREEEFRSESWKRALVQAVMGSDASASLEGGETKGNEMHEDASAIDLLSRQEDAFRREIAILRDAVRQQESEMRRLAQLQIEQGRVIQNLREARTALQEERNNLEINARAFDSDHSLLSRALDDVQGQVDRLSSSQIRLLFTMFELTVDKDRGLRYPLINDLRLAYRPKGDVQWDEIQGAWSLAAQLLLSVATVFNFQSENWKIVPLSHCAKLIYTEGGESSGTAGRSTSKAAAKSSAAAPATKAPPKARSMVFNLGHPRTDESRALTAWNALLHAVIQHATVQVHKAVEDGILESASNLPSVPYEMSSPGQIGDATLARISPKDDAAWSKAIHCMSSNLLWLSECASIYVHQTTVLQAAATASSILPEEDSGSTGGDR